MISSASKEHRSGTLWMSITLTCLLLIAACGSNPGAVGGALTPTAKPSIAPPA